jgi:hypothetical protein
MRKPTFEKFNLTEDEYRQVLERNKKVSLALTHYLPLSVGAVLGILIYIIYYRPFTSPNWFQIALSIFVFGGFGLLFLGLPMVFFRVVEKIYFKMLARKSEKYQSVVSYDEEVQKYDYWRLRTDESLWKGMHLPGFKNELQKVFVNLGYQSLKLNGRDKLSSEIDFLLYKDYRLYPVKCFSQKKTVGVSPIRNLLKILESQELRFSILASTSGFTKQAIKFSREKNVHLLSPREITDMMKEI